MRRIDGYVLHEKIASGGMASVYLAQMTEENGRRRTVAVKRLHPHVVEMTGALAMFMDEARLSARVRHPNIVATLAAAQHGRELLLVMEYVHGVSLSFLESRARDADVTMPLSIVSAILLDVLAGLQAAHDATDEEGEPLFIVHRDVSPQNVMVAHDGRTRVLDFGIAKAAVRMQTTREGRVKGKLRYMAPEQVLNQNVSPRTDVYAAAVVLWELLTGQRLFDASSEGAIVAKVLEGVVIPPSRFSPDVSPELEAIVLRGLSRKPEERFASCGEMASALRDAVPPAEREAVAVYVRERAGHLLRERATRIAQIEQAEQAGADSSVPEVAATVVVEAAGTQTVRALPAQTPPFEPAPADDKPRRRRAFFVASALVLGLAGLSLVALRSLPVSPEPSPPALASPSAVPVPVPVQGAALPMEPAPRATSFKPEQEPDAEAPKAPPKVRPAVVPPPRARPSSATPQPSTSAACDPMFTVDANGIRRVKPECL